ncbi:Coactivator CBP, KIX domain-containing protein [Strongyloides ratti]|uniref:Coactivator CBP, KIX domain-containing protein n=1 Tax=Strongyloides ratti TaxID=34506 RepID=A0A090LTG1_STRRB|nr:Coactivator CBP, KIX domain-containing protein [Strongyloides ratti]CEF71512.1 Coactivator CBP, KIX domain-containing protein [Strongyloides ratti]
MIFPYFSALFIYSPPIYYFYNKHYFCIIMDSSQNGCQRNFDNINEKIKNKSKDYEKNEMNRGVENPMKDKSDWRENISDGLREHLRNRLVTVIIPYMFSNERSKNSLNINEKIFHIENSTFYGSNNKEEYFRLMAEKIHAIYKELHKNSSKPFDGDSFKDLIDNVSNLHLDK